eukprot:4855164-Prymnesium_polylepis.2
MTVHGTRKPVWRAFEMLAAIGEQRLPVTGFVSPADGNSTISVLATLGGGGLVESRRAAEPGSDAALGLTLLVSNYRRAGNVQRYSCDKASAKCVEDPKGSYTDAALCGANCPGDEVMSATEHELMPPLRLSDCPAKNITITLTHTPAQAAALPAAVIAYRIDDAHSNPQAAWKKQGSPTYPTAAQLSELDAASQVPPAEAILVRRLSATRSALSFLMPPYSVLKVTL